VTLKSEYIQAY